MVVPEDLEHPGADRSAILGSRFASVPRNDSPIPVRHSPRVGHRGAFSGRETEMRTEKHKPKFLSTRSGVEKRRVVYSSNSTVVRAVGEMALRILIRDK